jgi:hypothetical protein
MMIFSIEVLVYGTWDESCNHNVTMYTFDAINRKDTQ